MNRMSDTDERTLDDALSAPTGATKEVLSGLVGDVVVLGAGGKMGPTLAMMLKKASKDRRIYAISRFSDRSVKAKIEDAGIDAIAMDLLEESIYSELPDAQNVFYLVGMKFGSIANQPLTWALNSYVPTLVARRYKDSRIVALSTGNVYPLVDISSSGASEKTQPSPIGEYAQSCLGRERMFEHFSTVHGTPVSLIRLNYANEPRYGIIVDLTMKILSDKPIDLTTGAVNLIWQRDANDYIIRSASMSQSPPAILNVTGPGAVPVCELADRIGKMLGKAPKFVSQESQTALLSDASLCFSLFGYPQTTLDEMIDHIVQWVKSGKRVLNKPTKYDVRDGGF